MKKTGAEIIIDALIKEKVDVLFGYPGGVLIPLFDKLNKTSKLKTILVRHEQAAAHAADGYARATGKTGVCIATSGPGATNLITGIATAYLDSIPMVALTGQVRSSLIGTDAFQEADILGVTRTITKHNFLVSKTSDLPRILKEAFYIANSGRPGPVLVDLPVDITTGVVEDYKYPEKVEIRGYKPNIKGHPKQIKRAVEVIGKAKRPILYAGGGIVHAGAHKELLAFAEKTNIPVTTTLMGLGAFPGDHKLFMGMPGMHGTRTANYSITECDLIISVGARFDDRVTGDVETFAPNAKIIHVDIDPSAISKIINVDVPVVGDAKQILVELTKQVKQRKSDEWNKKISDWKDKNPFTYKQGKKEIAPQYVVEQLYKETKGEAIITTEVGQNQMWAANFYKYNKPRKFLSSGGLGTMGYGLPAAMGAQFAKPNAVVIDIAGDGSIQMNMQELATISINKLPVKVVILNNAYLGMVRQWQELFWDKNYSSTCLMRSPDCPKDCNEKSEYCKPYIPDFVQLAKAFGIEAFRTDKISEVNSVLKKGLKIKGPVIMEFMVKREENVFPMVPAGNSINEMIGD